jgi:hypothetical protein
MNKALDEVRAEKVRRMLREGRVPLLKKSRWLLLKREKNLKSEQRFRLRDLLRYNLRTVRAYLLKEAFQQLWDYNSPTWAAKFLDEWCRQTMRSRIEPMKKIARSLRQHASSSSTISVRTSCFPSVLSRAPITRPKSPSEDPTVFEPPPPANSLCITHLASCPSRHPPTVRSVA